MTGYGSKKAGGFNAITKEYKRDPSLENYVRLRRKRPKAELEVAVIGGFEQLFYMQHVVDRYGIDIQLVAGVMDADPSAISEMSLILMDKIIEAKALAKKGETHLVRRGLAIPDKLIDWIICCSLDAFSWHDELHIPRDLIVLIRERLGGSNPEYEQASKAHEMKGNAAFVAGQLKAQGDNPTFKMLAEVFGVSPSTVKRWFGPGEFEKKRDFWASKFDSDGKLKPLLGGSTPLRKKETAQR